MIAVALYRITIRSSTGNVILGIGTGCFVGTPYSHGKPDTRESEQEHTQGSYGERCVTCLSGLYVIVASENNDQATLRHSIKLIDVNSFVMYN